MRTTHIPYDRAKEVLAVLELSSASAHAPTCAARRRQPCSCHVERARALQYKFRHAAKLIPTRADQLREGQWLHIEQALPLCVVAVQNLPRNRVLVRVNSGDAAGSHPDELTFAVDEQVSILDQTI